MKIVQARVKPITKIDGEDALLTIQRVAKTCYKTNKNSDDMGSAVRIANQLMASGHHSMFEFYNITMNYVSNIAAYKDLRTHRHSTFAVESTRWCVAGDTKLKTTNGHNRPTIEELYNNKSNSKNGAWKRMRIAQANEDSMEVSYAKIKDIFYNGKKEVYEVKTKLGYTLKCTADHKIYTPLGYRKLQELAVGDFIYVNGVEVEKDALYKCKDWLYHQSITLNKTFVQIAKEFGYNVSTLKMWKRKHGLPSKGTGYFNVGRHPWNKGLDESNPTVKKQSDALRKYHHNGLHDPVKIKKIDTANYQVYNNGYCEICGTTTGIEVHHIDENRQNNFPDNLISVCKSCHAHIHRKSLTIIHTDKIISIKKIGVKKVYDIEMDSKYHNFNANGIIVHNCNYSKGKFGNEIAFLDPIEIPKDTVQYEVWLNGCKQAEQNYMQMCEWGATPDQASLLLPQSTAAEFCVTANLREWRHILSLRAVGTTGKPRPCVQQIMIPTLELFYKKIPVLFDDLYEQMMQKQGR